MPAFQMGNKNDEGVQYHQGYQMVPYILKRYNYILITLQTISPTLGNRLNNTRKELLAQGNQLYMVQGP